MTQIDPNIPFTRDLLRTLTATIPAQPDETEAEYADRSAAAATGWAAFHPRDTVEQMLAAQIVAAHYAALDCLTRAVETEDTTKAERLRRSHATMTRGMRDTMRQLDQRQQHPADTEAPPAIEPIPALRRSPAEPNATHYPMQSEKPAAAPKKDPAKMTDEELNTAHTDIQTQVATALFDNKNPCIERRCACCRRSSPGIVVPDVARGCAPPRRRDTKPSSGPDRAQGRTLSPNSLRIAWRQTQHEAARMRAARSPACRHREIADRSGRTLQPMTQSEDDRPIVRIGHRAQPVEVLRQQPPQQSVAAPSR
jgi:hypothetical protein